MTPYAAILAGGSGTRFWPASTRRLPKQLLPLTGGAPLLRETVDRLAGLVPPERTLVVTAERHAERARELLPELPAGHVLGEPVARNTAAACALAAHWVHARDPDGCVLTLPADHVVTPADDLRGALGAAAARARDAETLVTLGLRPTFAATGYGWIEIGEEVAQPDGRAVHTVASFVEKPDRGRAELFLARGTHLWNLGMFAWRARAFLDELEQRLPEVACPLAGVADALAADAGPDAAAALTEALARAFDAAASISVDHGVLERSERVEVLPCSFEWDDLGSFGALARHVERDEHGNAAVGDLLALDAQECIAWAEDGRLTALLGVNDLIVVHANGVTLVAPRHRAEEVKRLVAELGARDLEEFA